MKKINIVHLVEDLNVGGLEKVIAAIAIKINKDKFNIRVWCLVKGGEIFDELKDNSVDVEVLGMKRPYSPLFHIMLARKLKDNDIHIVHTHGIAANGIGRMAAVIAGTPVIIKHIHTLCIRHSYKSILKDIFLNIFTHKIICCSKAVANFVIEKEKVNSKKVIVIYNGVDIEKFKERKTTGEEEFTIGCVASLYPHKGHKYLLEAVKKVIDDSHKKIKLIIVGDGILSNSLKKYARELGIQEFIEFKGTVYDVTSVIATFDVAVLPSSEREGLGLSLIEAMAASRPVIGTKVGGIPEVIKEGVNGILVEPRNPHALAKAILTLINNKEITISMGREGRKIAETRFSLGAMIENIESLYGGLFKRKYGERCNILYTSSFSSMQGGGQRSTYLLIKHLNKVKFSPFLAVPDEGELSKEVEKLNVKTFAVGFRRIKSLNIIGVIKDMLKIIRIIKDNRINIIHTESPRQTIYCGIAGKLLKVPLVMHLRVSDSSMWLDRVLYFFSDYMIAVSLAVKERFKRIDNKNKIDVVYNGVDLDEFIPADKEDINSDILKIGYFGRIEERKGLDVLIEALKHTDKKIRLVIRGDGDEKYLNKLKELSKGLDVEFKEYKKDIRSDMRNVDIVALPSVKEEGLSRIIIEAMAMGKVVVASNLKSNKEALGKDYSFLFTSGDYSDLSSVIDKIASNKDLLYKFKNKLSERAATFFDVKKNTQKIEGIYSFIAR